MYAVSRLRLLPILTLLALGVPIAVHADGSMQHNPVASLFAGDDSQIRADLSGVRSLDFFRQPLSERFNMVVEISKSNPHRMGLERFDQTVDAATEMRLEGKYDDQVWTTRLRSLLAMQDVDRFVGTLQNVGSHKHRAYTLEQGWRQLLTHDLSVELLVGAAQCVSLDRRHSVILPLGGIRLLHEFEGGTFSAMLGQEADTSSALNGLYGGQISRVLSLEGTVNLAQGLNLLWNCKLLKAKTTADTEGMLDETPVISAGLGLEYTVGANFSGSIRYSHRQIWEHRGLSHGYQGPSGSISLQYAFN